MELLAVGALFVFFVGLFWFIEKMVNYEEEKEEATNLAAQKAYLNRDITFQQLQAEYKNTKEKTDDN